MHINILLIARGSTMNIPEMLLTILIAFGIGKISEYQSPKYYDLETVNGNVYSVKVEKKSAYACPLHCKAEHYHNVIISEDSIESDDYFYSLLGLGSEQMYINSHEVIDLVEVNINKDKKKSELKMLNVQTYLP